MILDALTRAEHERQLEKQPDLKFVTPVKPQKKNPSKIWLWVGLAALANILILLLVIRTLIGDSEHEIEASSLGIDASITNETPIVQQQNYQQELQAQPLVPESAQQEIIQAERIEIPTSNLQPTDHAISQDVRPLAMEANNTQVPEVDRPLVYESKLKKAKPNVVSPKPRVEANEIEVSSKGKVSFSSTELNVDAATPILNKPKLLIEGVNDVQGLDQISGNSISNVPSVRDLPESTRSNLRQYEVNVHVFDDDPVRRFVLINMDKYKEGDRIVNNGPLVQEITTDGVVVDYGTGRALLPPK